MKYTIGIEFRGNFWDMNTDSNQIFDDLYDPINKELDYEVRTIELPVSHFEILKNKMIGDSTTQSLLEHFCHLNPNIEFVVYSELEDFEFGAKIVYTYLYEKE